MSIRVRCVSGVFGVLVELMGLLYDAKQIAARDPAARSVAGVIFLYPGFRALVYYKFSHFFFRIKWRGLASWKVSSNDGRW